MSAFTSPANEVGKTPLDDSWSARLLIRAQGGTPVPPDALRRMTPEWTEGLTLLEQDGEAGLTDWVGTIRRREPGRADSIQGALDEARREPAFLPAATDPGPAANEHEPAATGPERVRPRPRLPEGTPVKALDHNNFGHVVEDFGDEVAVHFVSPSGAQATVRLKRENLRRSDGSPLDPLDDDPAEPFDLKVLGTADFIRADYRREWLIKGIAVKGRPGVIGGPQKSMKTSTTVDLIVALACAGLFFGRFAVPSRTKVLLISGESGAAVVQETCRRVCRSRGIDPDLMEGYAFWGFDLPRLDEPEQLAALARFIKDNGVEVVILDPLYLCLLSGGHSIDPANLFDVGPLLKTITRTCLEAGATPFLVHHFRKNRENPNGPPELEDLSFAGVQEFARQWLLINRRARYEPGSGVHRLWFSVGGSDGHSGEWAVDISEGAVGEDFGDREWVVSVDEASRAKDQARERAEATKAEKAAEKERKKLEDKERRRYETIEAALGILRRSPDGLTRNRWRELIGCSGQVIGSTIATLLGQGRIEEAQIEIVGARARSWSGEGYRFVTDTIQDPPPHAP